jgi:hypothetical protein
MPSARAALKKAFNSFTRENNVNQIFQTGKQQPQKKNTNAGENQRAVTQRNLNH